MIDAVAEITNDTWDHVWNFGLVKFFNIYSYRNAKIKRQNDDIKKWKKQH